MTSAEADARAAVTPGLPRRLACLVYEGVLAFGVVTIAGLAYGIATDQRHALVGSTGLQILLLAVLALYFSYFWSRTGQTLAMLTWHIRLVRVDGRRVSMARALCRFLLAWLWFVPALALAQASGLKSGWATFGILGVGVLIWAQLSRLHPDRQYWHDAFCGTRLIVWRKGRSHPLKPP